MPCTLRCPSVQTGEPAVGLPGAGSPSAVIRRILPPRSAGSWAGLPRPPSPVPATWATAPTSVTPPSGVTRTIRALSRSLTSADPSGRNAMPQGTSRPVATTPATVGRGAGAAEVEGDDGAAEVAPDPPE